MEKKNAWEKYPEGTKRQDVFTFAEEYRKFISSCKTERECAGEFYRKAKEAGFADLSEKIAQNTKLKAGDRIVANNMGKGLALFVIGEKDIEEGMNILGAHIDSPRMDLKQVPLYEDTEMALLDTHYYGGVKKYQWVTLPLALHGVICKKDGTTVTVNIGEKPEDPVFGVSDLLIHLAGEQMEKKASKVIEGENLDLLVGSIPAASDDEKEKKEIHCSGSGIYIGYVCVNRRYICSRRESGTAEQDKCKAQCDDICRAYIWRAYGGNRSYRYLKAGCHKW